MLLTDIPNQTLTNETHMCYIFPYTGDGQKNMNTDYFINKLLGHHFLAKQLQFHAE